MSDSTVGTHTSDEANEPGAGPSAAGASTAGDADALFDESARHVHAPAPGASGEAIGGATTLPPVGVSDPVAGSVIVDDWGRIPADPRPGATVILPAPDDPGQNPLPERAGE